MSERPPSVLQLLLDLGVDDDEAWRMVEPIKSWFDGMSAGLAEAMLPALYAACRASTAIPDSGGATTRGKQ